MSASSTTVRGFSDTDDIVGTTRADETVPRESALRRLVATPASFGLTIGRLALGGVMFAHAAQKVFGWFGGYGFEQTYQGFSHMMPGPLAFAVIVIEFASAVALLLGVLTRLGALGIGAIMVGAIATVHAPNGFFMNWMGNQKGEGFEYHLLAIALAIVLLALGGGRLSIDRLLARRRPAEGGGIDNRFAMG